MAVVASSGLASRPRPRVSWVLRLPYPVRVGMGVRLVFEERPAP